MSAGALLHGSWSNPLGVFIDVGPEKRSKKKIYRVPVEVKIPLGSIALLPYGDSHRGKVRVRVAFQSFDAEGFDMGEELEVPITVPDRDLELARASHYTVSVEMQMNAGLHRLAVGVWDEIGAEAAFVPYDLAVGGR